MTCPFFGSSGTCRLTTYAVCLPHKNFNAYSNVAETKIPGLNCAVPSFGSRMVTGKVELPLPGTLIGEIL